MHKFALMFVGSENIAVYQHRNNFITLVFVGVRTLLSTSTTIIVLGFTDKDIVCLWSWVMR
jgi:hypothetical protein